MSLADLGLIGNCQLDSPLRSLLDLLAEDLDPTSNAMWGNFPQAYSPVGLIHAAFAVSPRWSELGV